MGLYIMLIFPALLLSIYAQIKVNSTFKRYSQVRSSRGYTGAQAANAILTRNGIGNVNIEATPGSLTDYYDPSSKSLRLSETVFGSNSIAAIGVAAHEVGHAIQHSQQYGPLELRRQIVPLTNFASSASFPIIIVGALLNSVNLIMVGIVLFSAVVVFHLVTLPVEFNASHRAVVQLAEGGLVSSDEIPMVKKVLSAAAFTYLAATLAAIANLLYYILAFMGDDR